MSKHRGKIIGRSYAHKVGEILRIYDEHARSGLSNREILRRYIYPVYPICEKRSTTSSTPVPTRALSASRKT